MKTVLRLWLVLAVILLPIFLVSLNVRFLVNNLDLYLWGFEQNRVAATTGLTPDQLEFIAEQFIGYFNSDREPLDIRVRRGETEYPLFTEREILHLRDVKGLVVGLDRVGLLTGLLLLGFVGASLLGERRAGLVLIGDWLALGGALTLGLFLVGGLALLVGFDRLFLLFHLVSFRNDLWVLDPAEHNLIRLFPEPFWFSAALMLAAFTTAQGILALFLGLLLGRAGAAAPAPKGR